MNSGKKTDSFLWVEKKKKEKENCKEGLLICHDLTRPLMMQNPSILMLEEKKSAGVGSLREGGWGGGAEFTH